MATDDVIKERPTIRVGRIDFSVSSVELATDEILSMCERGTAVPVRLANAYCVAQASDNDLYEQLMRDSGITYPDGKPVVWFMKLFGDRNQNPSQVRGPSLFLSVLDKGRTNSIKHFFLGTDDVTLQRLESNAQGLFPGLIVSGKYAPPFTPISADSIEEMARHVRIANPDIVWVALGTPKQDFVASELSRFFMGPVVAVGAAFDFVAGTRREAPQIVQCLALEWLFRFVSEPRRLWKRYTVDILKFLVTTARDSRYPLRDRNLWVPDSDRTNDRA